MALHLSGKTWRALKIVTIVLLVALAIVGTGLYVAKRAISVDYLRTFLQAETRALTGRELTIDGELRLRIFSLRPRIQMDEVRLSNATWSSRRDMVRVKRLEAEIDLLALIGGTLRIDHFNLQQPEVLLETNRQGRGNWVFEQRRPTPAPAAPRLDVPPLALDVRGVRVTNGRVLFRNGVTGEEQRFDLTRLKIRSPAAEDPLSIDLAATVNGRPFTLVGSVGSLIDLRVRPQPLPLEFMVRAGDARAKLTGALAQPLELAGVDVRVAAAGDELAEVMRYFGVNAPDLGRYRLDGRLTGSVRALAASEVILVVNDGRAKLTGAVKQLLELAGIDVRVTAEGDELAEVTRYFGIHTPALGRYRLSGRLRGSARALAASDVDLVVGDPEHTGARLQGAIRDVLGLAGADLLVSARVADPKQLGYFAWLTAPTLPPLKLQGHVTQSRDGYAIRDFAVHLGNTSLSGTTTIAPRTPRWKLTAQLTGPLVDMRELTSQPAPGAAPPPPPKEGERLFSDKPLSLGWLDAIDLDLRLQAERLVPEGGSELYAVNAHVVLADGKFSLDPLLLKLSPGGNTLSVRLRAHATPAGKFDVNASAQGAGIEVAHLVALAHRPSSISGGPTDVTLDVHATGGSLRELMAGLNGEAKFVVGAGQVDERTLDRGADLFTRFFVMAYPFAKEKSSTPLECAVVRLPVRDGIVTINRSIALETQKVRIAASGIIDLQRETIELHLLTHARQGLGLGAGKLTNMYKIQGSLAAPSVGLSSKGALRTGISTGAAVGTVGMSLLVERLVIDDRHPCRTALGPPSESN